MALHWLDEYVIVRRETWTNDISTLATVFTNVIASVQQDEVPVSLAGGGFAGRTYTVFMDNTRTIKNDDRLVTSDGRELTVMGVKRVTSGSEDYQQISCKESQG